MEPAPPPLVLTDEELTLLAGMVGAPAFPYARARALDRAARDAVARALAARDVLARDGAARPAVDALLGIVLSAGESLRLTIVYAPQEGDSRHEVVWLKSEALVRQTVWPAGIHHFRGGSAAALGELLANVLTFPAAAGSEPGEPRRLARAELDEAVGLLRSDGVEVASVRHPAAAGYVAAVADARRLTAVAWQQGAEGRIEGEELTLVESRAHGLWLERDEPAGGAVVLRRIDPGTARALVGDLARR